MWCLENALGFLHSYFHSFEINVPLVIVRGCEYFIFAKMFLIVTHVETTRNEFHFGNFFLSSKSHSLRLPEISFILVMQTFMS